MIGTVIGDIVGSIYEFGNIKTKDFELFSNRSRFTDDTVMSIAIAKAIVTCGKNIEKLSEQAVECMQSFGNRYPNAGYGGRFRMWIYSACPKPYNSFGNGAAMRVGPCAYAADSLEEALKMSDAVTAVTHNHPEGIKGARAVTEAAFMALHGSDRKEISDMIENRYYNMDFCLDDIRDTYEFDVSCQGSVPQAIEAFLEADSFEDTIRNAVSLGGDSDTIAAIAGTIAEAYFGVPESLRAGAYDFLDENLIETLEKFEREYCITR
ncbi:MAG: ADP-ribosylglycohydrolase family protein [Firmicutes bacterium]|nr:ADP-ribosylglycohydrolase family protein [Bacillota bacterium]